MSSLDDSGGVERSGVFDGEYKFWSAFTAESTAYQGMAASRGAYWSERDRQAGLEYDPKLHKHKNYGLSKSGQQGKYWKDRCGRMLNDFLNRGTILDDATTSTDATTTTNTTHSPRVFHHALDICCAPGGFMEVLLKRYPSCNAVGVTLPEERGGSPFLPFRESALQERAVVLSMDIRDFEPDEYGTELSPDGRFDVVLADGAWWSSDDSDKAEDAADSAQSWTRLLVMSFHQVRIAVQTLRPGGMLLMRVGDPYKGLSGILYYLLAHAFKSLKVFRPLESTLGESLWSRSFVFFHADGCLDMEGQSRRGVLEALSAAIPILTAAEGDVSALLRPMCTPELQLQLGQQMEPIWRQRAAQFDKKRASLLVVSRPCQFYRRKGWCRFGANCRFRHN